MTYAEIMESLRPMLSIGWLPAALVCAAVIAGLVADMLNAEKSGVAIVAGGLGAASILTLGTALLPMGPAGTLISNTFGVVLTGGTFAGLAFVVYLTAFLSCGTGFLSVRAGSRAGVAALVAIGAATGQVLLGASDVVILFVALELLALVAYALVASAGNDRSDEAAARYFVQGSVATGLAVLGLAVLVGLSAGASGYAELGTTLGAIAPGAALLGGMLLVSAMAFKLGAFPFHSWVPDAYETAPAGAAAFLSASAKAAAIGGFTLLLVRLTTIDAFLPVSAAVSIIAAASILFGNLAALRQTSIGRMLGYSAIAQAGYALVGASASPLASESVSSVFLFSATYAVGAATAFLVLEYFTTVEPAWDGSIEGLAGFATKHPAASGALSVALLSMTGIPLTAGFWGKFFVFYGAAQNGLVWLVIIGLIGSAISFGYYGRVIRSLYIDAAADSEDAEDAQGSGPSVRGRTWPSVVGAAVVLIAGVAPLVWGLSLVYALFLFQ